MAKPVIANVYQTVPSVNSDDVDRSVEELKRVLVDRLHEGFENIGRIKPPYVIVTQSYILPISEFHPQDFEAKDDDN